MIRNILRTTIAATAIALAGPALADPGGGHGGGQGNNAGGNVNVNTNAGVPSQNALDSRVNSQGPVNASPNGIENSSPNSVLKTNPAAPATTTTTVRGQGTLHANPNAVGRASSSSVHARGTVQASALPGLTTGLTVNGKAGTSIGTVSRVVTDANGNIRLVLVTGTNGRTLRLMPNTLSINAGVVTTTSM